MTDINNKTVLEHLLDNNKGVILSSRYQNTVCKGKTLCEYFGVKSKTKKAGLPLSEFINEAIFELPAFCYKDFIQNTAFYKKYPQLRLRVQRSLYPICGLIEYFEKNRDKEWLPIIKRGMRWISGGCRILYINKNTMETKEKTMSVNHTDAKNVQSLCEPDRDEYLMKTNWSDYEVFMRESKSNCEGCAFMMRKCLLTDCIG